MIYLTRKEHFNAAHKLYNPLWSKEKNYQVYGDCSNENWHGHNYELLVTIKGSINDDDGMVINLKLLSKIINDEIISKVDHKNLNIDVPFLKKNDTTWDGHSRMHRHTSVRPPARPQSATHILQLPRT